MVEILASMVDASHQPLRIFPPLLELSPLAVSLATSVGDAMGMDLAGTMANVHSLRIWGGRENTLHKFPHVVLLLGNVLVEHISTL